MKEDQKPFGSKESGLRSIDFLMSRPDMALKLLTSFFSNSVRLVHEVKRLDGNKKMRSSDIAPIGSCQGEC